MVLTDSEQQESQLAFLGDETSSHSVLETEKIVELLKKRQPDVLAVDCPTEAPNQDWSREEKELKEEGFSFTPSRNQKKEITRLRAIDTMLKKEGVDTEIIRFDPHISAEELALDSDSSLESLGVDTDCLDSSREFDAMLGAVTARFYQQNQFKDLGVIVPGEFEDE